MKLKPCPFCGSEALAGMGNTETLVGCSKFQCAASARHVDVSGEQWNTRHYPQEVTDVLEAAKMLLKELPQLNCSDLRHNKGDHHPWDKDCKPKERYDVAALRLINALKTTGV